MVAQSSPCLVLFPEIEIPVDIKAVHDHLRDIGETQLSEEIMCDYKNLLLKLQTAITTLHEKASGPDFTGLKKFIDSNTESITRLLRKVPHFMDTIDMSKVNCQVLSTDGFVSQIVRVAIGDNNGQSTSVIVKTPETRSIKNALIATIGEERTEQYYIKEDQEEARIDGMMDQFNREIDFYNYNDVRGLKIPSVYHGQKWTKFSAGALVMEDLTEFKSVSFFDSLSLSQVEQIGEELKILHNYSKSTGSVWREYFHFPKGYLNLLKGLRPVVEVFVDQFPQLDPLYQKFKNLYDNHDFIEFIMMHSHRDLGLPDVVCHGDLWTYNFLWHADRDEEPSDSLGAIIDWQGPHTGSVGEDFAHMLVFCCSPEVRRQAERELLPRHYYKIKALGQYYQGFTLQNFMRAYYRQLVMHAMHLPFIANVMLRYKEMTEEEHARNTQILLDRITAAWEDAWYVLQTELPQWVE